MEAGEEEKGDGVEKQGVSEVCCSLSESSNTLQGGKFS